MLALTLLSFAAAASALAIQDPAVKLPLPLGDITWTAPPELGNISFTGSHTDIISQISALSPQWQSNATYLAELVNATSTDAAVHKRSNRVNQFCSQWGTGFFQTALVSHEMDNLKYVLNHYGTGNCAVGARTCGRFSC